MSRFAGVRLSTGRALLYGTLAVGVLDILDAFIFYGARGARPMRILQSIASGLLGRPASLSGGYQTAALGLVLHFFIAFGIVAVFLAASRRLPVLVRHAVVSGVLYGIAVYFAMNYVVLPLSAVSGPAAFSSPVFINGILIHMFGVGLPSALAARAARK